MILTPGTLTLSQLRQIAREQVTLELDPASFAAIDACAQAVADIAAKGEPAYGINTASAVSRARTFRMTSSNCCSAIWCSRTPLASVSRCRGRSCAC